MSDQNSSNNAAPILQQPGAGLPWWEALMARYIVFPLLCRRWTWEVAAQKFQEEGARVLAVFDTLPPERLRERVLVRRITGMEDSSRFWSAAMTVEHLNMVGSAILWVIDSLRRGDVPATEPRTADFKPQDTLAPAEARTRFLELLEKAAQSQPPIPRCVGLRYGHPWFGPLDAHQWHCLLAFHQSIHRKQIEAIAESLRRASTVATPGGI